MAKRFDADACTIFLIEPDLSGFKLSASIGLNPESVGRVRLAMGEGLVGLAAEQREPLVVERAPEHPKYKYCPETGEERFVSLMAVPLIVRDVPVGVIEVQTCEPRKFGKREVEIFQTCAQLVAPVVVNARLLSLVGEAEVQREKSAPAPAAEAAQARPAGPLELRGMGTVRGIAIGPVYRLEDPIDLANLDYKPSQSVDQEEKDLLRAIQEARHDLDNTRDELGDRFGPDFAAVFNTHIQILEDKGFIAKLRSEVRTGGSALGALVDVLAAYRRTFARVGDPYFRERMMDVEDVGRRVMERILGERQEMISLTDGSIVVADNVLPSHFARLEVDKMAAIVSEHGGPTSHGAIFARTLEIPAVTGVAGIQAAARPGEMAIVDGGDGAIYLSPDEHMINEYQRARQRYAVAVEHLDALRDRLAETRDGRSISLTANCGLVSDLRLVDQHGAEGIGLFRTEMLALVHRGSPGEEEQKVLYERVAQHVSPRPVTIRTLDLGGDKDVSGMGVQGEENPQLGCRSIRLSLANLEGFRQQLRAILRASVQGNVRMLLPMISSLSELRRAQAVIADVKRELARAGTPFDPEIPIGLMIEVPSAALTADILARECDFFSIGTNDLTQYTLAVDRGNEHVAHLYDPLHPGVLALIDYCVRAGARAGIPVAVCGEMASNPLAVPILVGLGLAELSGTPSAVPIVREIVHALEYGQVEADARLAREAGTAEEVHAIGAKRVREAGLLEHPDIGPWLRAVVG